MTPKLQLMLWMAMLQTLALIASILLYGHTDSNVKALKGISEMVHEATEIIQKEFP